MVKQLNIKKKNNLSFSLLADNKKDLSNFKNTGSSDDIDSEQSIKEDELQKITARFNELNDKYVSLFELSTQCYITLNVKNGIILDINNAAAHFFGMDKEVLVNKNFYRYIPFEHQPAYEHFIKERFDQKSECVCDIKLMKRNGSIISTQLKNIFFNENQLTIQIRFPHHEEEISSNNSQKYGESYLVSTNAKNEFGSIIAYEISHPLTAISNYIYGCLHRINQRSFDISEIVYALKKTSNQIDHISNLILYMKNFSFKNKLNFEITCIDLLIEESILLIENEFIDFSVSIHYRKNNQFKRANIDKLQIKKVLLHLLRNSMEIMRDEENSDPKLIVEVNYFCKNMIEICVIDNGGGFNPKNSHQLFLPHFTTKPYASGMGLSICREIITLHGGELTCELNATYGACFKLTLPVTI